MTWKNKKVVVTGGAGVIGRELIKRLVAVGSKILCIDREPKPEDMDNGVDYCKEDIVDMDTSTIINFKPEIIFHLAASFERTEENAEFWNVNFRDNIIASHKIVEAARDTDTLKKFIFASSYLIYDSSLYTFNNPPNAATLLSENDAVFTRNLIGSAKYYTEKELDFMAATEARFITASARIFRVYGCGSKDIISRWIRMAIKNEELIVFKEENIFDYIYSGDVAEGLIKIAEKVKVNKILNLGSGNASRIKKVVESIRIHFPNLKFKEIAHDGYYEASCSDVSAFSEAMRWRPAETLENGIKKVVDYEKKHTKS